MDVEELLVEEEDEEVCRAVGFWGVFAAEREDAVVLVLIGVEEAEVWP